MTSIAAIIDRIINWSIGLLVLLAVLMVIYAAFLYLFGTVNDENIKKAKKIFLYTAVAIGVALLSKGFVILIANLIDPDIRLNL